MINWIRKYEKPETFLGLGKTTTSVAKTKAILASLGMGEDFIDELSTERLNEYANSKSITATTAYIKTTPEGVSTYVTKEDAENGSRGFVPPGASEDNLDDPGSSPYWSNESTDSYMRLFLMVTELGDARYRYSADAEWLTEPNDMRWLDTIAIAANSNTVDNSTVSGYFRYTRVNYTEGEAVSSEQCRTNYTYPNNNLQFRGDNGWQGYALAFYLPEDEQEEIWTGPLTKEWVDKVTHHSLEAHIQFTSVITYPEQAANFNVMATYSHSTVEVVVDFGIDIGFDFSAGIHLSTRCVPVNRYLMLPNPISYVPEN